MVAVTSSRHLLFAATLLGVVPASIVPAQVEPSAAPKPEAAAQDDGEAVAAADAAPAYRRVVALLRGRFGPDLERMPYDEHGGDLGVSRDAAIAPEWREATAAAAPALEQWRLAVALPRCRFAATGSEPLVPEFLDLVAGLHCGRTLVVARGLQAIADADADAAVATVAGLLAHAVHLRQEHGENAWAMATGTEVQAAALHEAIVAAFGPEAAERSRAALQRHLERRPGIAALAAVARIEMWRLFDGTIARMSGGDDATARLARDRLADVRRRFASLVEPLLAVYDGADDALTAE